IAIDIAHGVRFPLLGPVITSGTAQLPGPFSNWLAAFPQLFTRAPEAGNEFFELMGAASVWMFWYALRCQFGGRAAAFAAVLAALLYIPLAIHEARTGLGNTRVFFAETLGGHKKTPGANLSWLLSPIYMLRFLTLDVTYHELSGYWGGLNESAAWQALWHGSA